MASPVDLPKLPPPEVKCGDYAGPPGEGADENYFTADQMTAYASQAVLAERERCARLCESKVVSQTTGEGLFLKGHRGPLNHDGQLYAAAIRSIKD